MRGWVRVVPRSSLADPCLLLHAHAARRRDTITKYAPVVFDLIDKDFKPDFVCQLMHICDKPGVAASEVAPPAGGSWVQGPRSLEEMAVRFGMLMWGDSVAYLDKDVSRPWWLARSKQQS